MLVGIDASNIRAGGGVTHLTKVLAEADPAQAGIRRIILWATDHALARVFERPWLEKRSLGRFGRSLVGRLLWQQGLLPGLLRSSGCRVLFSPGGTLPARRLVPSVTMSQNLLPFEPGEAGRYSRVSAMRVKLRVLRVAQSASISGADGVIFLSRYAREAVEQALGAPVRRAVVIPHGIEDRFRATPRPARPRGDYGNANPFRLLYVSIVDLYKHQWHVAEATAALRREGMPLALDLVGPAYAPAAARLQATIARLDSNQEFLFYRGPADFKTLHTVYRQADAFVFASSCENLPNILIEAMAAGLPIACSRRGPMPEVLGDAGLYFDPERPAEIAASIRALFENHALRARLAQAAWERSREYSWRECAARTFRFVADVAADARNATQRKVTA